MVSAVTEFQLTDDIWAKIQYYQGELRFDIRKYSRKYPTKFGVSLNISKFRLLAENITPTTQALQEVIEKKDSLFEYHIGNNVWVKVESPYAVVHIRKRALVNNQLYYTRYGISLKLGEWRKLVTSMEIVDANFSEIKNSIPCIYSHDANLSALYCIVKNVIQTLFNKI